MKPLALLLCLAFLAGCSDRGGPAPIVVPEPPPSPIAITTADPTYPDSVMSIVNLTFSSTLTRDVRIIVSGCGFVDYTLERKFSDGWRSAYGFLCPGISFAPLNLHPRRELHTWLPLHPEDIDAPFRRGTFRLRFRIIEATDNTSLADTLRCSNEFQITNQ